MREQIVRYAAKLKGDGVAKPGRAAVLAQDDQLLTCGAADLVALGAELLARLNVTALALVEPAVPFVDFLLRRASAAATCLIPSDTETRTFLHDIPLVRVSAGGSPDPALIARLLGGRKGVLVEGVGIVATGALTPEQAYINVSSVFHAVFVKYLLDLLTDGFRLPGETEAFFAFRRSWGHEPTAAGLTFAPGSLTEPAAILAEIERVGRYTVERGLVDSFFGNISCRAGGILYISQSASSLDALAGCIDPVPLDQSSTVGLTASSELPAHRRIYELTHARTILHGHPKFAVVLSLLCEERADCEIVDCWKDCPRVRLLGGTPVVAGEVGAGGLAKRVPPVMGETGRAIVYGHGVFTLGRHDFAEAFSALVEVERWCRTEYFRRLDAAVTTER